MKWEDFLGKMVKLKSGDIWFYGILSYSAKEYVLDNGDSQLCFFADDDIDEIVELKEAKGETNDDFRRRDMTIEEIDEKIKHTSFCHRFDWNNKIYVQFADMYEGEWYATYDIKKGELKLGDSWGAIDDEWRKEILEVCNEIKPIKKCIHSSETYKFVREGITPREEWEIIKADEKAINETGRLQK